MAQWAVDARPELLEALGERAHEAGQYSVLGPDPWQVLWHDNHRAFVAFLEGRRSLVVWRSPVGDSEEQTDLTARMMDYASWVDKPLFMVEVNETTRAAGVELSMTPIWTGAECILDLPSWSLAGGRRQKVRWARSHATKLGVTWREARPLEDPDDWAALAHVEQVWKAQRPERGNDSFLRNSFSEIADLRRYFVGELADGVIASVTCTPVSRRGWYLQDIVRLPDAPRGALEGAMAFALDTLRDEGFAFASNGPLPFWRPDQQWSDPDQLGAIGNRVLRFFDRQYRFGGINQFRSKFEPDRIIPLYVLRSRRLITPGVARSLTALLNDSPGAS